MTKPLMFIMECLPGTEDEYEKRHQNVNQDLLDLYKAKGVANYSLFMDENKIYGYMEVDDFEKMLEEVKDEPANIKWQEFMKDILVSDASGPKMKIIKQQVFYLK